MISFSFPPTKYGHINCKNLTPMLAHLKKADTFLRAVWPEHFKKFLVVGGLTASLMFIFGPKPKLKLGPNNLEKLGKMVTWPHAMFIFLNR